MNVTKRNVKIDLVSFDKLLGYIILNKINKSPYNIPFSVKSFVGIRSN